MLESLPNSVAGLKRGSNTGALLLYICEIFKKIYFEKYLETATSEDLSGGATLVFRSISEVAVCQRSTK